MFFVKHTLKIRRNSTYKFAVDNIGISLVDTFYHQDNRMIFPLRQDFQFPKFHVIHNTKKWITICGEVAPDNCPKYIVIGNFKSDQETYILPSESSKQGGPYAHYFIDDVEIYKSDTLADCFLLCNPKSETLLKQTEEITKETFLFDTLSIKFEKGIDKKRINYNYYGEKLPIADNSTENGKKLNRRIDLYFTEK